MEINTEGIQRVGELVIRNHRGLDVVPGAEEAFKSGRVRALAEVEIWAGQQIRVAGPYDDVRALQTLQVWLADRIRETQVQESPHA